MIELWRCEQLVLVHDEATGLRAAIAIHDTTLGPGLGGVRFKRYAAEADGVVEAQRLAAAMTVKNAVAELPYGGAKAVILDSGAITDRAAAMRRFGEFVSRCGGAYLPGVDMGTTTTDLALMAEAGAEVACNTVDPSPWTALGVAASIRAAVQHLDGRTDLEGVRALIQGAGHVGSALAADLAADGAQIILADVDHERAAAVAETVAGTVVPADQVLGVPCDVFAPCAAARVISPQTVASLRCRVVAGAANDTLSERDAAELLAHRCITYVPDFVANAGGVIQIHALRAGHDEDRLRADVLRIGDRVADLLAAADQLQTIPLDVAEQRARAIIAAGPAAHPTTTPTQRTEVLA